MTEHSSCTQRRQHAFRQQHWDHVRNPTPAENGSPFGFHRFRDKAKPKSDKARVHQLRRAAVSITAMSEKINPRWPRATQIYFRGKATFKLGATFRRTWSDA